MARRAKIAVSVSEEVISLLDRHAHGRSRSRCVEEELLRALRAREWERLGAQTGSDEEASASEWAAHAWQMTAGELRQQEQVRRRVTRAKARPKRARPIRGKRQGKGT